MLTKTKIALSTLLVMGSVSTAFAFEPVENKINHRYPFLKETVWQSDAASAFAYAPIRHPVKRLTANERALFEHASQPGN